MALSGIQIYKLLPQTNCKECGFPTCLAFAMKLAAKQVELSSCPYVSEASKVQLAESSAPPVRLITLKGIGTEVKVGNEVCLYRHEKTFFNKTGLFVRIKSSQTDIAACRGQSRCLQSRLCGYGISRWTDLQSKPMILQNLQML